MNEYQVVTYPRVKKTAESLGITLHDSEMPDAGYARINGADCYIAVIAEHAVFIRAERPTSHPELDWTSICNRFNTQLHGVKAVVLRGDTSTALRTESEIPVAARMSEKQLSESLSLRLDVVLAGMKALSDLDVEPRTANPDSPQE